MRNITKVFGDYEAGNCFPKLSWMLIWFWSIQNLKKGFKRFKGLCGVLLFVRGNKYSDRVCNIIYPDEPNLVPALSFMLHRDPYLWNTYLSLWYSLEGFWTEYSLYSIFYQTIYFNERGFFLDYRIHKRNSSFLSAKQCQEFNLIICWI